MHGDKKIGLALGVLLIGIVGAFFFRNEPAALDDVPQLENAAQLDAQIAEKPVTPYLTGVETEESAGGPRAGARSAAGDENPSFEMFVDEGAFTPFAESRPAPVPIPMPATSVAQNGPPRFDHNRAWERAPTATAAQSRIESAREPAPTTHQVRPGDTLSGLAFQYLGSSARYHEIFAANRDVLKSPDDLRVGLTLRIPMAARAQREARPAASGAAGATETGRSAGVHAGAAPAQNVSAESRAEAVLIPFAESHPEPPTTAPPQQESGRPSRLFQPARRSPFVPRVLRDETSRHESPVEPVKVLSQAPPEAVSGRSQ